MRWKSIWGFLALWLMGGVLMAQTPHFEQHREYYLPTAQEEGDYDEAYHIPMQPPLLPDGEYFMRRTVYGFHPGWRGTTYQAYNYKVLPVIGYYGYIVDPVSGSYSTLYFWKSSPLIQMVKDAGGEVELVLATGSAADNRQLLSNPQARVTLRDSAMALLRERNGHGFCLDFEALPGDQAEAFVELVSLLSDTLRTYRRKPSLTICLPGRDPEAAFDIGKLRNLATRFIIKPYSEYDASQAGPSAPLGSGGHWGQTSIEGSLAHWLKRGVSREMIVLSVPLSGQLWDGKMNTRIRFSEYRQDYNWKGKWDATAAQMVFRNGSQELWIDEERSLEERLNLVYDRNLEGVALVALGDDHGFWGMQQVLEQKMTRREASSMGVEIDSVPPGWIQEDGGATRLRNEYNWIWMLVGCIGLVIILLLMRRYFK